MRETPAAGRRGRRDAAKRSPAAGYMEGERRVYFFQEEGFNQRESCLFLHFYHHRNKCQVK